MTVTLNKANFANCEFGISSLKRAKNSDNSFYWVLIYPSQGDVMYCATSESFTKLLGTAADDSKLVEVLAAHQGEFEIANITDDDSGTDATFEDGTPIFCIRKRAHRMAVAW